MRLKSFVSKFVDTYVARKNMGIVATITKKGGMKNSYFLYLPYFSTALATAL